MTQKKKTSKKTEEGFEEPVDGNLSERHEAFIREYLKTYNATKAYQKIYKGSSYDSARANSSRLLTNDNIKTRIDELKADLEKSAGITRLRVVEEFASLAFSSFANINRDWLTQKEFDELSESEKACISEIKREVIQGDGWDKEVLKIKLHDKQRALENLAKIFGYYEQDGLTADMNISINIVEPKSSDK